MSVLSTRARISDYCHETNLAEVLTHCLKPVNRCEVCGLVDSDVVLHSGYVGGHGYRSHFQCNDLDACWKRHEQIR